MAGFHRKFAVSFLTSLAIIFLSSKLVFACVGVVCDDGTVTNGCAIEARRAAFSWLFYYALLVLEAGIIFLWLPNKIIKLFLLSILAVMFLPFGWVYWSDNKDCGLVRSDIAEYCFFILLIWLIHQLVLVFLRKIISTSQNRLR